MTREEWYKHRIIDCIESVAEYVEIMLDGAMYTELDATEVEDIYHSLALLQCDMSRQLRYLHEEESDA